MVLSAANTSVLVAGSHPIGEGMTKITRVKVLRGFYQAGKLHAAGTIAELPELFAREMVAAHKAEAVAEAPAAAESEEKPKGKGAKHNAV